uniref:Integrase core domain-containing protein n=1 Tax=Amphimedon queenslandica TaxID=400682 RepID=A0A1X7VSG1_AMPQE
MTGLLASKGIRVSQVRVGQSLKAVGPLYHLARCCSTSRKFNPAVYTASNFGHKLHIDQNEKICMYGVTHVAAFDGYSGMIVGFVVMAVKNNILSYEHLFRRLLFDYGMWDQLRVDKGREWFLILFIQEKLCNLRGNTSVPPYLQSSSQMNHAIKRIWLEVNRRVNYPVKKALNEMLEIEHKNLDDASQKY